ncbi:MAG: hypothetical protein H7Z42_07965 [Roseiflexaceae bacterium]|nr:hypothetical protein [Roseiflexaceae bacterium]
MFDRAWLRRVGISLALALIVGALVYLVARGASGAWLLFQQQQLLRDVLGTLQSGLEAPPAADLRAISREVAALDARNTQASLLLAALAAAVAAAASFVWQERAAIQPH